MWNNILALSTVSVFAILWGVLAYDAYKECQTVDAE